MDRGKRFKGIINYLRLGNIAPMKEVIQRVGASKEPGPDGISNGLLKACDKDGRLSAILAKIT